MKKAPATLCNHLRAYRNFFIFFIASKGISIFFNCVALSAGIALISEFNNPSDSTKLDSLNENLLNMSHATYQTIKRDYFWDYWRWALWVATFVAWTGLLVWILFSPARNNMSTLVGGPFLDMGFNFVLVILYLHISKWKQKMMIYEKMAKYSFLI